MTGSRAWRQVTGYSRMSVGRVQSPVLAMVVRRELAIEGFKSVEYFVPVITMPDGTRMRWMRREGAEGAPGFDSEGRIVDESLARQIVAAIMGGNDGKISLAEAKRKYQAPPLPFSMGTLQSTAGRRYGLTLKEVTDAASDLYMKHKMITYTGTDCQFLPTSMLQTAGQTVRSLGNIFGREAAGADMKLVSKAWNDAKTDEHFAIAPTGVIANGLSQNEKSVFEAISRRFMAQFYPNHEFTAMRLQAKFGLDEFKAVDKQVTKNGWKDAEFGADQDAQGDELDLEAQAPDEDEDRQKGDRE
jgi:DNA topoisomerase-3